MQEMSRKNKLFTDSVIRRMTRVSLACGAINLAQGFPDFDPPKALTDRLAEVSALGPHQYPITMGAPNFRQALARKAGRFMGRTWAFSSASLARCPTECNDEGLPKFSCNSGSMACTARSLILVVAALSAYTCIPAHPFI